MNGILLDMIHCIFGFLVLLSPTSLSFSLLLPYTAITVVWEQSVEHIHVLIKTRDEHNTPNNFRGKRAYT